jgi:hypothetical protein
MKNDNTKKCGGISACGFTATIVSGVVFAAIAYLIGGLIWGKFFADVLTDEATKSMWRPVTDPIFHNGMIIAYLVFGLVFAKLYRCFQCSLSCCKCGFSKGAAIGLKLWLIAGVVGPLMWYVTSNIPQKLALVCSLDKLLALVIGGMAVGFINEKFFCASLGCKTSGACSMPEVKAPAAKAVAKPAAKKPATKKKAPAKKKR